MPSYKVYKKDKDGNIIHVFNSVLELEKKLNVSEYIWRNKIKNQFYEGFYYYIDENEHQSILYNCDFCGKEFILSKGRMKQNSITDKFFCSAKCCGEYNKGKPNCNCCICGKPIHVKPENLNQKHTCSSECLKEFQKRRMLGKNNHQYGLKGKLNASWKSDEKISAHGYKLIRCPDHPFKNGDGFVFEHRLIAEKYLLNNENSIIINDQKFLSPDYVVHHIDFNRLNNSIDNLYVLLKTFHQKFHNSIKSIIRDKKGRFDSVINPQDIYSSIQLRNLFFDFLYKNNIITNLNKNNTVDVIQYNWFDYISLEKNKL